MCIREILAPCLGTYSTGGIKCFGVDGIKMRDADNMRDADVDDDFNKL